MTQTIFITGIDTEVGKTYVNCHLLKELNAAGHSTFAIKPVASGCTQGASGELRNEDALALQQHASIKTDYDTVNPIRFEEPIAPHIAANHSGKPLTKSQGVAAIKNSIQPHADFNLVEGVGGWAVPLNDCELFADIVIELKLPVILVVGIKLGCLNHALLTYQSLKAASVPVLGWIGNCIEPNTLYSEDNINTLKQWIDAPCLGLIGFHEQNLGIIDVTALSSRLELHPS